MHKVPQRAITDLNAFCFKLGQKCPQCHMRFFRYPHLKPLPLIAENGFLVPANLANRHCSGISKLLGPAHRRGLADRKSLSRQIRRLMRYRKSRNPLPKIK